MTSTGAQDELAELRARVAELEKRGPKVPRYRVRALLAVLLIVLAAVLTPLSAVANRVTDAVMQRLDVATILSSVEPADRPLAGKDLDALSGPVTTGISGFVHSTALKFVSSDAFATLWTQLNRRAHAAVEKALTGSGGGAVKLTDDAVIIDLAPVIEKVKQALVDNGLAVASKIPEVHTVFN
ncbi:hypothetical protein [Streptomyces sp. NPDC000888]